MTFILRWLLIVVLLFLAVTLLGPAVLVTLQRVHAPIDLSALPMDLSAYADASWLLIGLLYAAGVFFLIASIRLMRKTQGFWAWLLGFAAYGAEWGLVQQHEGGLMTQLQGIDWAGMSVEKLAAGGPEAQVAALVIMLIVGLLIFIVDWADRAYWDSQSA